MTRREEAIERAASELSMQIVGAPLWQCTAQTRDSFVLDVQGIIAAYEAHMRPEIASVEELDALPNGTVIKTTLGEREPAGRTWAKLEGSWWGMALEWGIDSPSLPARVIHWGTP